MNELAIASTSVNGYTAPGYAAESRKKTANATPTPDSATFSDSARQASEKTAETEAFSFWRNFSISGESFGVETNADQSKARLTFTDAQGQSYSLLMDSSSVLRKGEDGRFAVVSGAVSESRKEDYATMNMLTEDGIKKTVYQKDVQYVQGSDADDIVILLPGGIDLLSKVDAGEGDNVVIDLSKAESRIQTGSGKDTVVSRNGLLTVVDSGDGDDIIDLDSSMATVRAGGGNDIVTSARGITSVDGGDGNDTVDIKGMASHISGSAGNDVIRVRNLIGGHIDGGDGDDIIEVGHATGEIRGGAGNDKISVDSMFNALLDGGDGDDTIDIEHAYHSQLEGAGGSDVINAKFMLASLINGGDGDNTISMKWGMDTSVNGGEGDDEITAENAFFNSVDEGDENPEATVMAARSRFIEALFNQRRAQDEASNARDIKDFQLGQDRRREYDAAEAITAEERENFFISQARRRAFMAYDRSMGMAGNE